MMIGAYMGIGCKAIIHVLLVFKADLFYGTNNNPDKTWSMHPDYMRWELYQNGTDYTFHMLCMMKTFS